jgi:hypothetical protein
MSDDERKRLTLEEAIALLPPKDRVHTFVQVVTTQGALLVGADWDRTDVIELIQTNGAELAGPAAAKMGHGLVVVEREPERGPLFIETAP